MNDMHMHCVSCKQDQWLPEDCPHCSYCGSRMLWEIVEDDLLDQAQARITSFFISKVMEGA